MKKNGLFLLTIFFSLCLGFTACKDNDDNGGGRIEDDIFGVYKGVFNAEVNGVGFEGLDDYLKNIPQKVYLDKINDNKVKIALYDFAVGPLELGDITIQSADIRKEGSNYIITGTENLDLPVVETCKVNLNGTIKGNNITLDIKVEVVEGEFKGLKVIVDFEGTKLNVESEAEILEFKFDPNQVEENALVKEVEETEEGFSLIVDKEITEEQKAKLVPTITVSEGATIEPKSGVVQDFNKEVVYTVTAKDGTQQKYTVRIAKTSTFFDFEEWGEVNIGKNKIPELISDIWSTSNVSLSNTVLVESTEDKNTGEKAAKVMTIDSSLNPMFKYFFMPRITSGALFLGEFKIAMPSEKDPYKSLESTKFGVPTTDLAEGKPLSVQGVYKYKPGEIFFETQNDKVKEPIENKNKVDEFSIRAVVYEKDAENVLDGISINDNSKYIGYGELTGGKQDSFKEFNIELDYGKNEFDPAKEYMISVIFSSSKEGDRFSGAPGSELIIDSVEVVFEK